MADRNTQKLRGTLGVIIPLGTKLDTKNIVGVVTSTQALEIIAKAVASKTRTTVTETEIQNIRNFIVKFSTATLVGKTFESACDDIASVYVTRKIRSENIDLKKYKPRM